ncbi:unnamed protein product [Dovyalis caffra]|uniref:Uncharacterized protein n=1 Tax=Dovyalis caffra TaxID=77055 RepID=A0AAV1ST75_9ROSI|nr:unnamed protein product [Dovyalis caffra]
MTGFKGAGFVTRGIEHVGVLGFALFGWRKRRSPVLEFRGQRMHSRVGPEVSQAWWAEVSRLR